MARLTDSQLGVLNLAAQADLVAIEEILVESDFHLFRLHGADIVDQASLLAASIRDLPGMADCRPHNWSSLADCVSQMVFDVEKERVALLWTDAHRVMATGMADFLVAADILTGVARFAYAQDVAFVTFLLGEGPNFPRWPVLDA